MDLRKIFIENLKKYRKECRLSQMALAELCNTSTSYIGEIEIGKKFPSVEMIQTIAMALNIEAYKLFVEGDKCIEKELSPELKEKIALLKSDLDAVLNES